MFKAIVSKIDNFLNKTTMYRLVFYYLAVLFAAALFLGLFGVLPYSPTALLISLAFVLAVSVAANTLFGYVFEVATNVESIYVTALILTLIIPPPASGNLWSFLPLAFWASLWAMASKYMLAIRSKHLFNPAAFGVALTALTINGNATWWVGGNLPLAPFVIIGGLLVVRKIKRSDLVWSFFVAALASIMATTAQGGGDWFGAVPKALLHSPIFFFAFVMLTEPLTTPPTRFLRIFYGALVGVLYAPAIHLGGIYSTPELALLVGNIFSYLVSPKTKLTLRLKDVRKLANDTYDFIFTPDRAMRFKPGQYLEWTLPGAGADNRGNRRYFTIASSPTERDIHLGVKFYNQASTFKKKLASFEAGDAIHAGQLAGDFTMPRNKKKKLVFIAGGIGITPFRSMVKYLADSGERRVVTLLYSNRSVADAAYKDWFDEHAVAAGIKVFYTLTDAEKIPAGWTGGRGILDDRTIRREIPDWQERVFYISGPQAMVSVFRDTLKAMGVRRSQIKTDFFPGFA